MKDNKYLEEFKNWYCKTISTRKAKKERYIFVYKLKLIYNVFWGWNYGQIFFK